MIENDTITKEIEFLETNRMSLRKFYRDLEGALETQNEQSVWALSKIITRYQIR